jgi:hypothetical protein
MKNNTTMRAHKKAQMTMVMEKAARSVRDAPKTTIKVVISNANTARRPICLIPLYTLT